MGTRWTGRRCVAHLERLITEIPLIAIRSWLIDPAANYSLRARAYAPSSGSCPGELDRTNPLSASSGAILCRQPNTSARRRP